MGGRHMRYEVGTFHNPRDTLDPEPGRVKNRRISRRMKQEFGVTQHGFFVPSYGVRRPVEPTQEVQTFLKDLREALPRNYLVRDIGTLAVTSLEQRFLVTRFRDIGYQPERALIRSMVDQTKQELRNSLEGIPRELPLPLGRVDSFGKKGFPHKLGIIPLGWKGYRSRYSERGPEYTRGTREEILPIPVLVRESRLIHGIIETGLSDIEGFQGSSVGINPMNMTPHITIAEKRKGGSISQSELAAFAGVVSELMPDVVELYDPIINIKSARDSDFENIHVRSPRGKSIL